MPIPRVEVNHTQIKRVADVVRKMKDEDKRLNFYSFGKGNKEVVASDMYPEKHHSGTIDFFSFACLHQFGFWNGDQIGYNAAKQVCGSLVNPLVVKLLVQP